MPIDSNIMEMWRGVQVIAHPRGQLHHRAIAIQAACDLEAHLSELLSAFFSAHNPRVTHETAFRDLYSDGRVLSSLRKMTDVGFYLGLITDAQRHDLKALSKLRDRYAHVRSLGQLEQHPELFEIITKMHLYRDNKLQLSGFEKQAVFMCIKEQLESDLKRQLEVLTSKASQVSDGNAA